MNILILGGTGFIGRQIVESLIDKGHHITLVIHKNIPEKFTKIKWNLTISNGDVLYRNTINDAFSKQDIVINLVGQMFDDKKLFYDQNIVGALNILELCVENRIHNIIHISSSLVYGESGEKPASELDLPDPKTNYSLTKFITENIYIFFAKKHDLNITILRLSNVYGPEKRVGVIYNIIKAIKNDDEIIIFNNGKQMRDFIYIDDAVDAILEVIEHLPRGVEIFNISSATKTNMLQIISTIENYLHKNAKISFAQDNTYNEKCSWADNTKIKSIYNVYSKVNLKEGIKKILICMEMGDLTN